MVKELTEAKSELKKEIGDVKMKLNKSTQNARN